MQTPPPPPPVRAWTQCVHGQGFVRVSRDEYIISKVMAIVLEALVLFDVVLIVHDILQPRLKCGL